MNALFLKDLATKTHRGLKGRALTGKSAGGLTYGYKAILRYAENGEPIRGDREVDSIQARVVRRIFTDYIKGLSPKKIAEQLNLEKVPGPQGGHSFACLPPLILRFLIITADHFTGGRSLARISIDWRPPQGRLAFSIRLCKWPRDFIFQYLFPPANPRDPPAADAVSPRVSVRQP